MTDEMKQLEKAQEESNEIYRVAARVKNYAREKAALTPAGEALCNMYVHVMKAYYTFADTLSPEDRKRLIDLTRTQEKMPGKLIVALGPASKK